MRAEDYRAVGPWVFAEHLNPKEDCIMWRDELLNGTGKILTFTGVNQAAVLSVIVAGRR